MITNICLLLEALTIVFCLHYLYGEKFKLDIYTTSFLAIDMIVMTIINYYELSKVYTMLIYPIIAVYCGMKFGFKLKEIITNVVLCIIIVGAIQAMVMLPLCFTWDAFVFADFQLMLTNCVAFLIVLFALPKCRIDKFKKYIQNKEKILTVSLIVCFIIIMILLLSYKGFKLFEINQTILLLISLVFVFLLTGQASEYKVRAKRVETELKMHKLYEDSFQGLIQNIRSRQHEFDNHINTIYSQHYIYKTYEELVQEQKEYCQLVTKENRFNKLLTKGNSVIIGFLYGKFIEIDKKGIDITYEIGINGSNQRIPDYKIVEILGNLIKNAVEALEKAEDLNKLFVLFAENEDFIEIEVRNESPYISYEEIDSFFDKGFSKKGKDRGFGLYNVKSICSEYMLDIYCENKETDGQNWLSFKVINREQNK